jgi:hypothetical protein
MKTVREKLQAATAAGKDAWTAGGADEAQIQALERSLGVRLPPSYRRFLALMGALNRMRSINHVLDPQADRFCEVVLETQLQTLRDRTVGLPSRHTESKRDGSPVGFEEAQHLFARLGALHISKAFMPFSHLRMGSPTWGCRAQSQKTVPQGVE